ncbi:oxygen-independent coproporphyrinogen III oxidase [Echinimonas agarilytica]|uniref:Coproporphyrinogen-III oxidase n=1 Tax=Echinimonas agarilytica TaxID=1215918 RepID=A0AA41W3S6_9GAMM|nr:oxygen-independent coproporphyrinogen III oxidase [Echinimonas agarilytica]MCM2678291.1 oxygen-independent coproporphyrinogen III oxidase [Echinimonas agarilytica]
MIAQQLRAELLHKYNSSGPRYTSYPTALSFHSEVTRAQVIDAWHHSDKPELSLYVHLPFCHTLCYYCGCNKVVTRHPEKIDAYLDVLLQEIELLPAEFSDKPVTQIHWGGGTPSYLSAPQCARLMAALRSRFNVSDDAQISIEVDPREVTLTYVDALAELGFNRMSIGVQDFSEPVQIAVNRVQSEALVSQIMIAARAAGFRSINLDLIYGLPHQTVKSFSHTLDQVIALKPDRLSIFNYAHLPTRFAAQRKIKTEDLPSADEKLQLLQLAIDKLTDAGLDFIGMDHFAKPDDELSKAQREGKLHRNFQGYTTHQNCDLLGLGVSSISQIGNCFAQNLRDLKPYYQAVKETGSGHEKGYILSQDDAIRQRVISDLICNMTLNKRTIEYVFDIEFDRYFANALSQLEPMVGDQLVALFDDEIRVLPAGKLLIRNICMCFDAYLQKAPSNRFSKVI